VDRITPSNTPTAGSPAPHSRSNSRLATDRASPSPPPTAAPQSRYVNPLPWPLPEQPTRNIIASQQALGDSEPPRHLPERHPVIVPAAMSFRVERAPASQPNRRQSRPDEPPHDAHPRVNGQPPVGVDSGPGLLPQTVEQQIEAERRREAERSQRVEEEMWSLAPPPPPPPPTPTPTPTRTPPTLPRWRRY
jgi:hypothetical protein